MASEDVEDFSVPRLDDVEGLRRAPKLDARRRAQDIILKDVSSPRYGRAIRFAREIAALLRDYLPTERNCSRVIMDHLFVVGYEGNAQIINVPRECDALDKLKLEMRMVEIRTQPLVVLTGRARSAARPGCSICRPARSGARPVRSGGDTKKARPRPEGRGRDSGCFWFSGRPTESNRRLSSKLSDTGPSFQAPRIAPMSYWRSPGLLTLSMRLASSCWPAPDASGGACGYPGA